MKMMKIRHRVIQIQLRFIKYNVSSMRYYLYDKCKDNARNYKTSTHKKDLDDSKSFSAKKVIPSSFYRHCCLAILRSSHSSLV
jgi:hypothetical protein